MALHDSGIIKAGTEWEHEPELDSNESTHTSQGVCKPLLFLNPHVEDDLRRFFCNQVMFWLLFSEIHPC